MKESKPTIIIMVGLSGSGKSSIAKELANEYNSKIVSSDDIRGEICEGGVPDQSKNGEVFKVFHNRIRETLKNRKNVIADATNITIKSRRAILENIKNIDCYKICYIVPKRYNDCLRDNKNREYPVPDKVIKKQMYRFQIPFFEEGFDEIIIHKFFYIPDTYCFYKMFDFDQQNPHHKYSLYIHSEKVTELFDDNDVDNKYEKYYVATYLHDIGKTLTQTFDDDGIAHYYGHAEVGSYHLLTHCNYIDDESMLNYCFLINYHMMPFSWNNEKTHNKYKKIFGEYLYNMLIYFNECDSNEST